MSLSERLKTIIELVPANSGVVDIGTDHAVVPVELARINPTRKIIGVEYNLRPYKQAIQKVVDAGLELVIDIRKGYGFDVVEPGEAETAIIAGLGSATIEEIIRKGRSVVSELDLLVLGPMDYPYKLREYLLLKGYSIQREVLIHEFRWYEIMVVVPKDDQGAFLRPCSNRIELQKEIQNRYTQKLGFNRPFLLEDALEYLPILSVEPDLALGFLEEKLNHLNRILANIPVTDSTKTRRDQLAEKLEIIRGLKDRLCS